MESDRVWRGGAKTILTIFVAKRTRTPKRRTCLAVTRVPSSLLVVAIRTGLASFLQKAASSRYTSPPVRLRNTKPDGRAKVPPLLESRGIVTAKDAAVAHRPGCCMLLSEREGYRSISSTVSRQEPPHSGSRRNRRRACLASVSTGDASLPPRPRYAPQPPTRSSCPLWEAARRKLRVRCVQGVQALRGARASTVLRAGGAATASTSCLPSPLHLSRG